MNSCFLGVATILAVGILSIPQLDLLDLAHALEWVFLVLLPNYCLGQGIEDYYQNYKLGLIYEEYCVKDKIKDFCETIPNPCCIGKTFAFKVFIYFRFLQLQILKNKLGSCCNLVQPRC